MLGFATWRTRKEDGALASWWLSVFIALAAFMAGPDAVWAQPRVMVSGFDDVISIEHNQLFVVEASQALSTLAHLRAQPDRMQPASAMLPAKQRNLANAWWLRLVVENQTNQAIERWLDIPGDVVDVWLERSDGRLDTLKTGHMVPRDQKAVPLKYGWLQNYIPVALAPGEGITLWARVDHFTQNRRTFDDPSALVLPNYARLRATQSRSAIHLWIGFVQAVYVLVGFYCLVFYFYTGERYALMLLIVALAELAHAQLMNQFWYAWGFHEAPILRMYFNIAITLYINVPALLFIMQFLKLKEILPRWYRGIWGALIWLVVFGTVLLVLFHVTHNYALIDQLRSLNFFPVLIFFSAIVVRFALVKDQRFRIYSLALFLFLVGAFVATIAVLVTGNGQWALYGREAGAVANFLVLISGLSYIAAQTQRENIQAEEEQKRIQAQYEDEQRVSEELRQLDDMKSRFFANISHEFRTALTLTLGPIEDYLATRFRSQEQAQPHFERARQNGRRLLDLINQLLTLSKLDAGSEVLNRRRHDLANWLMQTTALFGSLKEVQNINFVVHTPVALPYRFDAKKLEQAVVNLISNAFKFTPSGGEIVVSLEQGEAGTPIITVADSGRGIASEHVDRVFDRFYQVEMQDNRQAEGTGIGLALTKELVELHGGTISVDSEVGKGTRFRITLPAPDESAFTNEAIHPIDAETDVVLEVPKLTSVVDVAPDTIPDEANVILIVEDNPDMRAYVRAYLEETFTVIEAENGEQGLARAIEHIPDLILSDVMMPHKDGIEMLDALRQDARTQHIPLVLLTAKADVASRIDGFARGADAYLAKPFNADELQARIRSLLERQQVLQRYFQHVHLEPATEAVSSSIAPPPSLSELDTAFLATLTSVIQAEIANTGFGVEQLAEALNLSRRQLARKLRALTDQTALEWIHHIRLEHARQLLLQGESVKAAALATGFSRSSYFSKVFRDRYGVPPSQVAKA